MSNQIPCPACNEPYAVIELDGTISYCPNLHCQYFKKPPAPPKADSIGLAGDTLVCDKETAPELERPAEDRPVSTASWFDTNPSEMSRADVSLRMIPSNAEARVWFFCRGCGAVLISWSCDTDDCELGRAVDDATALFDKLVEAGIFKHCTPEFVREFHNTLWEIFVKQVQVEEPKND